ncbi:hypothetical protein [Roseivirga misakiensis]|uniref:Uncharacterized protein n=1 Tax=Roseivirga misakiensis TaxID=1563681 RepID=A0A1E5T5R3_9BACT|nr:hypothetical protein [Roseivirga misakiensis]OEK06721.1 hypothetical protein BFP71_03400 [Roseivirga misakiensis]
MKTKLDKLFDNFNGVFWKTLKVDSDAAHDAYWKFKAEVLKFIGQSRAELKEKDAIIHNQMNEIINQKLEVFLYKSLLREQREKLDRSDREFEGFDKYTFEQNDVDVYNNAPFSFSIEEFRRHALLHGGADTEDADGLIWKYTNFHLISKRADGSYVKLLDRIPRDLNEIEFIKSRISI